VTAVAGHRPALVHRRAGQVEARHLVPARVDHKPAFLIPDLAVGQVLGGTRIPRVIRDLRLVVVVAERDVIEISGEDRAVQFVFGDRRKPLVLYRGCKPVGHEHVIVAAGKLDLVEGRSVILGPEHVRDQVEDRVAVLHLLVPEPVGRRDAGRVVGEDFKRRGGVPGLRHAVVPGDDDERDAGRVEPFERFEHGRVGPGLGLDRIEEVARVDEDIGLVPDNLIDRREEIVIDLLLAQVHPRVRVEPGKCGEAEVRVGDMDELHSLRFLVGVCWHIRGRGAGGK